MIYFKNNVMNNVLATIIVRSAADAALYGEQHGTSCRRQGGPGVKAGERRSAVSCGGGSARSTGYAREECARSENTQERKKPEEKPESA